MVLALKASALLSRDTPWLTEEAISFLEKFFEKHQNPKVLEFGGGASTVWFSKRTNQLYTIEHSRKWQYILSCIFSEIPGMMKPNFLFQKRPYFKLCQQFEDAFFDLIIVDGHHRELCVEHAISKLKKGGILILDDAEREQYQPIFSQFSNWECTTTQEEQKETRWWTKPL